MAPLAPGRPRFRARHLWIHRKPGVCPCLSSGMAIHLALLGLDVSSPDEVIVPHPLLSGATAFAVTYTGPDPSSLTIEEQSGPLDQFSSRNWVWLSDLGRFRGGDPLWDLLGRPADPDWILPWSPAMGVPVLVDAAGSPRSHSPWPSRRHQGPRRGPIRSTATDHHDPPQVAECWSSDDGELVEKARFWSTQSREPFPW